MASPTITQVKNIAIGWWRRPGPLRLDALRARIASLWRDPDSSVRLRIVNDADAWSIVVTLERRHPDGTIASSVTHSWSPDVSDMAARRARIADVRDDEGSSPSERATRVQGEP